MALLVNWRHLPVVLGNVTFSAIILPKLLEILWEPDPTKLEAKKGRITITDRSSAKEIQIDQTQIRAGHVYYRPPTGDLGIRMEVVAADGQTASESVQLVTAQYSQIKEPNR